MGNIQGKEWINKCYTFAYMKKPEILNYIPESKKGRKPVYDFDKLEVNQSLLVPYAKRRSAITTARERAKNTGKEFVLKTVDGKKAYVCRTK